MRRLRHVYDDLDLKRLERQLGSRAMEVLFESLAALGRLHPMARLERHGVEVLRDVAYRDGNLREHRLDVYRPVQRGTEPLPVCLYLHGGGFRILSKETHWLMGLLFARRGYVVFNASYRLAPQHPFPAALEDAGDALAWVAHNAPAFGGDLSRLVLAGESAGANLATALSVCCCFERPEPVARTVYELGVVPRGVVPACGILQASDAERFGRRKKLPRFVEARMLEVGHGYLPDGGGPGRELADPLCLLEQDTPSQRPLPAFYIPVGTSDPLLDDTRRLAAALERRGVPCKASYFPGEVHAFHAFIWREAARTCWRETFEFLEQHVPHDWVPQPLI
ncbi:MAG: alpha/beta hydrolase [Pseudomonadota bacterium]